MEAQGVGNASPGNVSEGLVPGGHSPFDMSQPGPYKWWEWTVNDFVVGDPWLQENNRCRACGLCLPGSGFYKCPCWHWTCFVPSFNCKCCELPKCCTCNCKCCSLPKPTGCRCVFPSTYLGVGWHCPYCCCGKCPCKLTEEEQLYWFRLSEAEQHKKPEEPKLGMCAKLKAKCPAGGCPGGGGGCPTNPMKKFGGGGGLSDDERDALFSLREIFKEKIAALPKPAQATMNSKKPKPGSE